MPQGVAGFFIAEHFVAEQRIGRLHRDIDRHMHIDNAVHVLIGEIGQRDIAALQKGKPRIVIFKVNGLAHPFRILVNKAEDTMISACFLLIHERRGKAQPQVLILLLMHLHGIAFAAAVAADGKDPGSRCKTVIQNIMDYRFIDRNQLISGLNPCFCSRRAADDICNFYHTVPSGSGAQISLSG